MNPADDGLHVTHLHDVILDEVLPDTHGCRHEFACLAGSLTITCQDLTAVWTPSNCPEQTPKSGGRTGDEVDKSQAADHPARAVEGVAEELAARTEPDGTEPDTDHQQSRPKELVLPEDLGAIEAEEPKSAIPGVAVDELPIPPMHNQRRDLLSSPNGLYEAVAPVTPVGKPLVI